MSFGKDGNGYIVHTDLVQPQLDVVTMKINETPTEINLSDLVSGTISYYATFPSREAKIERLEDRFLVSGSPGWIDVMILYQATYNFPPLPPEGDRPPGRDDEE